MGQGDLAGLQYKWQCAQGGRQSLHPAAAPFHVGGDTGAAMAIGAALTRMAASARKFDVASAKQADLALVAAVAPSD